MKKHLFLALSLLLVSQFALAQSLKSNMKSANTLFKQISATMHDPSRNAENAQSVQKMIALFDTMKTQSPDSGSVDEYKTITQELIETLKKLDAAFKTNDNAQVQSLIQKTNTIKKEGHDKFK